MSDYDIISTYKIDDESVKNIRADRFIAEYLSLFTRSQIKARNLKIILNGKEIKPSKPVNYKDVLILQYNNPEIPDLIPEKIDFDILYEDSDTLVINKPCGLVVHPGAGNPSGTLVNGLIYHYQELQNSFEKDDLRPGIVHRLDKETSGVIIAAKSSMALEFLSSQFREKTTSKSYLAIVKGVLKKQSGVIDTFIARDLHDRKIFTVTKSRGKKAVTHYSVIESWENFSLVHLKPETGRTHQLRVHMKYLGNPILGDSVYSRKSGIFPNAGLMLHALKLTIRLPKDPDISVTFTAPLPRRIEEIIKILSKDPDKIIRIINEIRG